MNTESASVFTPFAVEEQLTDSPPPGRLRHGQRLRHRIIAVRTPGSPPLNWHWPAGRQTKLSTATLIGMPGYSGARRFLYSVAGASDARRRGASTC